MRGFVRFEGVELGLGLAFRVKGLEFRVKSLGFWVWGLSFRVKD